VSMVQISKLASVDVTAPTTANPDNTLDIATCNLLPYRQYGVAEARSAHNRRMAGAGR
jgi:hypothetical protein